MDLGPEEIKREHRIRQRRYGWVQLPMMAGLVLAVWAGTRTEATLVGISPLWFSLLGFGVFVGAVAWSLSRYRCPACNARLFGTAKRVQQTGRCSTCGVALR